MAPKKRRVVKPKDREEVKTEEIDIKKENDQKSQDPLEVKPNEDQVKSSSNPVRISIAGLKLQPYNMTNLKIVPKGSLNVTPKPLPATPQASLATPQALPVTPQANSNLKVTSSQTVVVVKSPQGHPTVIPIKNTTSTSPKTLINISTAKVIPLSESGIKFSQLKLSSVMSLNPSAKQVQSSTTEESKLDAEISTLEKPTAKPLGQSQVKSVAKPMAKKMSDAIPSNKQPLDEKLVEISPKRMSRRLMNAEDPLKVEDMSKTPGSSSKIQENSSKTQGATKPKHIVGPKSVQMASRNQLKSASPKKSQIVAMKPSRTSVTLKTEPSTSKPVIVDAAKSPDNESRRSGLRGVKIDVNFLLGKKEHQNIIKKPKPKPKAIIVKTQKVDDPIVNYEPVVNFPSDEFACKKCPMMFETRKDFMNHRKIHTKSNYDCEKCHQSFKFASSFHNHVCDFWCHVCGKTISNKANLKIHLSYVHGIGEAKYFHCDICGRVYKSKRNIDTHMKNHMDITPFNCAICGKGFSHLGALKIHMWNHRDAVECEYCGRKFKPRSLYYHVKKCLYAQAVLGEDVHNVKRISMREEHLEEEVLDEYALENYQIEIVNDEED